METKLSFGFLYALNVPYVKSKKCLGYLVLRFISTVIGSSHCFNSSNIRFHFLPASGPERECKKIQNHCLNKALCSFFSLSPLIFSEYMS